MSAEYDLAGKVIGLAMSVHRTLGPGFVESVYEKALSLELTRAGISHKCQYGLTVNYKGESVGEFITDIVVKDELIVELKAVQTLVPIHEVQLVNYLTASGLDEGVLLNFGTESLQFKKKFRKPPNPPPLKRQPIL